MYPRCVYDAFVDFQLPEVLRTPLQSLCLQIKSLQCGKISEFLAKALQSPEPLAVTIKCLTLPECFWNLEYISSYISSFLSTDHKS